MTRTFDCSFGDKFNNIFELQLILALVLLGAGACAEGGGGSGDAGCAGLDCKLVAPDGAAGNFFGGLVALDANVVTIGAVGHDENGFSSGSAYVYRFDGATWVAEQRLTASDGAADDFFGAALAVDGDLIAVGANMDDDPTADSGSAYVFRFDGSAWVEEEKLTTLSGTSKNDFFGSAVAVEADLVDGDVIAVAAPGENFIFVSGVVYMYRYDAMTMLWTQEQRIVPIASISRSFGTALSLDGGVIAIGDNGFNSFQSGPGTTGSVDIYRFDSGTSQWVFEQALVASDGATDDLFGGSVSLKGNVLVVGAGGSDSAGPESGSAFVFRRDEGGADNWGEVTEITPSDTAAGDRFGWSVTISGDAAIVGADRDDDNGISSGSAYVYVSSACTVASCDDGSLCSFDRCVLGWCVSTDARPGDVAGTNGACGPNGRVDLDDIIAVLNGFGGRYADGCEPANIDIAGDQGSCVPNGITDLFDITAVLDAFAGLDRCCAEGR